MAKNHTARADAPIRFDAASYLKSEADMAAYLAAAFDEAGDDPDFIGAVIGDIAKARGVYALAEQTGLTPQGLYKVFGAGSNPSFATVWKIMRALGVNLVPQAAPIQVRRRAASTRSRSATAARKPAASAVRKRGHASAATA